MAGFFSSMKRFLRDMFAEFYDYFAEVFLSIIVMIVVMFAGLIISWFAKKLIENLLILFRFDRWAGEVGITNFLERGGVRSSPSKIIGRMVFWFLLIAFFSFGLNFMGVTQFAEYASRISTTLPHILVSLIIVVVGVIFSTFLSRVINVTCENAKIGYGAIIAKSVRIVLFIITFGIVFEYMGLGSTILSISFLIVFGGIVLTLSLALGIALSHIIADLIKSKFTNHGDNR
jgi:hypothetical protein